MTTLATLAMATCSNDNDWVDQPSNPDVIAPDAYVSFSISIPHALKTHAVSTDPGIATESTVESLHMFIYGTESSNIPTVAEFTVAGGVLTQRPARNSTQVTSQLVNTKETDRYIFAGINLNAEVVNYTTSDGLGAFSYRGFTQEITELTDQANGFVILNSAYPTLMPATDLYEGKGEAENDYIIIPVNRVTAKAAVFQLQSFVVNGDGTTTDLEFGWRDLNKKSHSIQDDRDALVKDYNWAGYTAEDFTRGTDAINVYASAGVSTSFPYVTENTFQCIPGTSNVGAAAFISVSGVLAPTNIISTKINLPTVVADFGTIVNPKPANKTFFVMWTVDGVTNCFIDGLTAEKSTELCVVNTPQVPFIDGVYLLSENVYSNGLCYYHIFINGDVVILQIPYNIYRNQYFKININSTQAPGGPSDDFDNGEPIKPNSWIGANVQTIPWEMIEEDHDL